MYQCRFANVKNGPLYRELILEILEGDLYLYYFILYLYNITNFGVFPHGPVCDASVVTTVQAQGTLQQLTC